MKIARCEVNNDSLGVGESWDKWEQVWVIYEL